MNKHNYNCNTLTHGFDILISYLLTEEDFQI